jgi:hypothetical protein
VTRRLHGTGRVFEGIYVYRRCSGVDDLDWERFKRGRLIHYKSSSDDITILTSSNYLTKFTSKLTKECGNSGTERTRSAVESYTNARKPWQSDRNVLGTSAQGIRYCVYNGF